MRADRLVSILLMLQRRGQVTAAEVALELETSERTARRDLEALGTAGLPIYSTAGRNGGWRLAGDGKTDLSGLSATEIRALFLVAGTSSGTTPQIKSALRKLVRALPESLRDQAELAASSVVVDPQGWDSRSRQAAGDNPPFLDEVQSAIVTRKQLSIEYTDRVGAPSARIVHPLGLAAKGARWYLISDTNRGLRTFRLDRMRAVEITKHDAVAPKGFNLEEAWKLIADTVSERRSPYRAEAVAQPSSLRLLRYLLGDRLQIGTAQVDGRIEVAIRSHSLESLAGEIAGLGSSLEILDPPELRTQLAALGSELVRLYAD